PRVQSIRFPSNAFLEVTTMRWDKRPFPGWMLVGIVLGLSLAVDSLSAQEPKAELREKVKQLVRQLDDTNTEKQAEAVTALLKLGPEILPLLPEQGREGSLGQKKHLPTIRTTLRDAQTLKELAPRRFTLKKKGVPLNQVLKELEQQTGNPVEDRRRDRTKDISLALDLEKVTFWEALDDIALRADLRVSYDRDRKVALVDGPHLALPVSHSGVFRTTVKRLLAIRDLEADVHFWTIQMEVAWEPRFQPLFVETQPEGLVVQEGKGV